MAAVWVQAKVLNKSHLVFALQMLPGINMVTILLYIHDTVNLIIVNIYDKNVSRFTVYSCTVH